VDTTADSTTGDDATDGTGATATAGTEGTVDVAPEDALEESPGATSEEALGNASTDASAVSEGVSAADVEVEVEVEVDQTAPAPVRQKGEARVGGSSAKEKLLDAEGDAAADYLEELLDIADLDGDIDIFVENGRASVAVLADEADPTGLQVLVGEDGEVLDALQELTRLAAQAATGERSRLLLDVAGFRENRRTTAAAIATEAVTRVQASGESVHLEPMPAYQRKAVHDAVAEAGLRSESDGAEPDRFVVIHPA